MQAIARALSETVRRPDEVFRWAGDEFAVLLGDTDEMGARRMAARLREATRRPCACSADCLITMGTGVAELRPSMTADELLGQADTALLAQKAHRYPGFGAAVPAR